ncbi:hypothetical protein TRSC58_07317 [Trypanosoma rangeli SC58]|uniref:Secreted protein n=1 Tax=Trypanosoma rangeli SC58 TaxID=429131 RepID=A0A061IT48_TRYRA|nr:hypothetical protein TRSC58_07317 [Trypanosoma rangeli SC58]
MFASSASSSWACFFFFLSLSSTVGRQANADMCAHMCVCVCLSRRGRFEQGVGVGRTRCTLLSPFFSHLSAREQAEALAARLLSRAWRVRVIVVARSLFPRAFSLLSACLSSLFAATHIHAYSSHLRGRCGV